jgi:hypothetical protein
MPVLDTMKVGAPKAQDKCIISQKMMVEWSEDDGGMVTARRKEELINNIVFYLKVTLCST